MKHLDRKIKICFVILRAYPLFNPSCKGAFGGAEINLYNLSRSLAENPKYEVSFIVGDYDQSPIETYSNVRVIKLKYFDLIKYKKVKYKVLRYLTLFRKILFYDSDIYITSSSSELLGWLSMIAGVIRRKKVIFRLASDSDLDMNYLRGKGLKFYLMYRIGLKLADQIVSQTQTQQLKLKQILRIKSEVIPNGFNITERQNVKKKSNILWVSRALDMKRPELFLEMAKKLPKEKFIIILSPDGIKSNTTSEPLEEMELKVINDTEQIDNVSLIRYVPFDQIQEYYDEAKLFVNTSLFEGFPNSFIQACISRTPILSFRVNPDNIISTYDIGYVCEDNMERAVDFLQKLTDEKVLLFGENAYSYVKNHHDISDSTRRYEDLFISLLHLSRGE